MSNLISDYLIQLDATTRLQTLENWKWLLEDCFTVWFVNRLGDLFLVHTDGSIHMLDVGVGELEKLADTREEFLVQLDDLDNADHWLAIPLVDLLVEAGVTVQASECYGFRVPPVLGGEYKVENVRPISLREHLSWCGELHRQIRDLPDESTIVLRLAE